MNIHDAFDSRFSVIFVMPNGKTIDATDLADMILDLWDRTPDDADEEKFFEHHLSHIKSDLKIERDGKIFDVTDADMDAFKYVLDAR